MFKEFSEEKIFRFKEFDEARGYIENFKDDTDTYEAVDYMINHKEYYFLLKNVLKQHRTMPKALIAYLFYNLPCLKREEDLDIIKNILSSGEEHVKTVVIDYLKACKNEEFAKNLFESGLTDEAVEVFIAIPSIAKWLKEKLENENEEIKRKTLKFFEIYDEKFAETLKEELGNIDLSAEKA